MKQFIKNRIKEIDTELTNKRNEVKKIDFIGKHEMLEERRRANDRIVSLETALKLNTAILKQRSL